MDLPQMRFWHKTCYFHYGSDISCIAFAFFIQKHFPEKFTVPKLACKAFYKESQFSDTENNNL